MKKKDTFTAERIKLFEKTFVGIGTHSDYITNSQAVAIEAFISETIELCKKRCEEEVNKVLDKELDYCARHFDKRTDLRTGYVQGLEYAKKYINRSLTQETKEGGKE